MRTVSESLAKLSQRAKEAEGHGTAARNETREQAEARAEGRESRRAWSPFPTKGGTVGGHTRERTGGAAGRGCRCYGWECS